VLNPADNAIIIAMIGASTEQQPLIAHAQGMSAELRSPIMDRPSGNGTPIKRPAGIARRKVRIILVERE